MAEHKLFELGNFALQTGPVIPDAKIGYATLGALNAAKDNVVLCPTWFTATPSDVEFVMTGAHRFLNPDKFFIVIPNHFGAGVSSSPSNTPPPFEKGRFPHVLTQDSIRAQHRLLTEGLGISRIRLATSWSMGACQCYAWAAMHPEMVQAIAPIAGSAKTCMFNKVFLAGIRRAIVSDPDWNDGFYTDKPPIKGLKVMATIYSGWGFCEEYYRREMFRGFGCATLDEFIELFWETFFIKCDANDLLAQIWTWDTNDISRHPPFGGDFVKALKASTAKAIILPGSTDIYFPPADSEFEAKHMPNAECRPVPTLWGHMCPLNPEDQVFIDKALKELV
jgi:homoserine O-acetyltransferase/O-succinyltransferase